MKYKLLSAGINDMDPKKGILSGYLSSFGNKDHDGDIAQRGCFAKTIRENGPDGTNQIRHLLNHNGSQPLGVFQSLSEDAKGLPYVSQLLKNSKGDFLPESEKVIACHEAGYRLEHSIGYAIIKEQKTQEGNLLQEVKLFEGSTLTFYAANEDTPVTGLKSMFAGSEDPVEIMLATKHALETLMRKGNYSDEFYQSIQSEYQAIGELIKAKTTEPEKPTQPEPDFAAASERLKSKFNFSFN